MRADELRIHARPRSGWEALDLGTAMARAWWRPIWGAWLLLVVPVASALIVGLRGSPWWTLLVLWWLRPLFGRVVLHVLGQALFAEPPSVRATARALPRILRGGVLASLTLMRFSPSRCYAAPVLQLEGLSGPERRARIRVLTRAELGPSASLHTIGAHVNGALMVGMSAFFFLVAPEAWIDPLVRLFGNWFEGDSTGAGLVVAFAYLAGTSVVEPLLVAAGFGLYVNRRMWLEGWDVEIALRRRIQPLAPAARGAAAALLLAIFASAPGARAETACVPDDPSTAGACAVEVVGAEEFGRWEEKTRWLPREFDFGDDWETSEWGFSGFGDFIAGLAEIALWVALAMGLSLLGLRLAREPRWEGRERDAPLPTALFGLELDPETLPEDVIAAAREAFAAGDATRALSLLYRAALILLIERRGLTIPGSATEGDCLRIVRGTSDGPLVDDFAALNDAWVLSRYARAPLGGDTFADLCRRWAPRLLEPAS